MNSVIGKLSSVLKLSRASILGSALPVKLTVGLTYQCQSKCNHCDIWKLYKSNPDRCKAEAQSHTFMEMLEDLGRNLLWIEFSGGEPFLRKEIVEIVSFALNRTGIVAAGITTNGLDNDLVLERTFELLTKSRKKQLVIGISIDGDPETYERVRGLNGFDLAMKTFLDLRRVASSFRNFRPHIAYTLCRFNAGSFPDFYKSISEEYGIGIEEFSFTFEHPFGYYFQDHSTRGKATDLFEKRTLNDIKFILGLRHGRRFRFANPLDLFYEFYLKNVSSYLDNPVRSIIPCKACEMSAYVDPYGYVYPCTMWNEVLGCLQKSSFASIWKSPKRRAVMQAVRAGSCPHCWTPCEAQPSWFLNFGFIRGWW
jgi:MoaA/NifB/PqqE/SkfB family radical SAM enzyme